MNALEAVTRLGCVNDQFARLAAEFAPALSGYDTLSLKALRRNLERLQARTGELLAHIEPITLQKELTPNSSDRRRRSSGP